MNTFSRLLSLAALALAAAVSASGAVFPSGQSIGYSLRGDTASVVNRALEMLAGDLKTVLNAPLVRINGGEARLEIYTLSPEEADCEGIGPQGFVVKERDGRLVAAGADAQGTAYAIMELSRMLGVSPWEWWADSRPESKSEWAVAEGFATRQTPAVEWRGIFINDEDNGFCPWAWQTHEPSKTKGRIGPKTHERVFQLMLRLRANVFWPAMHSCSLPFFLTPGNREMASRYGITIGTSHCEPMLRNTNGEWKKSSRGEYNYITNRDGVRSFWRERVRETALSGGFYTLGMRGIHDTGMEGVTTLGEQLSALQTVIDDQRAMLDSIVGNVENIPQVFIPYKEVLPVYHAGLRVPGDVMLMWCDDNYGFIRHLPTAEERQRPGGNGLYYHFSYWGRPQTHVWLPSTSPALVREELCRAYEGASAECGYSTWAT